MKNKSINQVSIINGEDGPTSVFIFGEAQKQSLKIRIRNAIYQSRRKRIEKRIAVSYTHLDVYKRQLSVCEKVGISPGFFSIDAGAGKHTYLLQESGKTINVDAKIKQLSLIHI